MPVGFAIGRGPQLGITAVQELTGRAEFTGPQAGLNAAQEEIENSQQAVRSRGGSVAGGLERASQESPTDLLAQAQANILAAAAIPERMYIQSVDRPEEKVEAQFNPEKLKETFGVDWQKFRIPGLSHQRLQYGSANNVEYRFELYFNAAAGWSMRDTGGVTSDIGASLVAKNLAARNQLSAWRLRRREEVLGAIGDTQRLLFVWPNFISLTCVLVSAEIEYTAFNLIGQPTCFRVEVLLEEIRDVMLYAEDVLASGTQRSGKAPEVV